jgi:hypothetical protein
VANVKDGELILTGRVMSVEELYAREDSPANDRRNVRAGDFTGRKVTVLTSGSGFSIIKVDPADNIDVHEMQPVLWVIRNSAYAVGDNSGMSTKFVRLFDAAEFDRLAATAKDIYTAAAKAPVNA